MNSKDAKLLRRYARHMFRRAMAEREEAMMAESNQLIPRRPPKDWVGRNEAKAIESDGHRKLVAWWNALSATDQAAARRKLKRELDGEAAA